MRSIVAEALKSVDYLDEGGIEQLTSRIIMAVGMAPIRQLELPPPVDGQSWGPCWQRGLDRIADLGARALR